MEAYNLDITKEELELLAKYKSIRLSDIATIGCDDCGNDAKYEIYLNLEEK